MILVYSSSSSFQFTTTTSWVSAPCNLSSPRLATGSRHSSARGVTMLVAPHCKWTTTRQGRERRSSSFLRSGTDGHFGTSVPWRSVLDTFYDLEDFGRPRRTCYPTRHTAEYSDARPPSARSRSGHFQRTSRRFFFLLDSGHSCAVQNDATEAA